MIHFLLQKQYRTVFYKEWEKAGEKAPYYAIHLVFQPFIKEDEEEIKIKFVDMIFYSNIFEYLYIGVFKLWLYKTYEYLRSILAKIVFRITVNWLIKSNDLNFRPEGHKTTSLMLAVITHDFKSVKRLVDAGANKYIQDSRGLTAIKYAKTLGNKKIYNYLTKR